jgi:ArsR family transcriptional regulator
MLKDPKVVELQSAICKIMSNPRRVQLLHILDSGEKSVGELVEMTGLRKAAVSQNLGLMRARKLVTARRDGQKVYYKLRSRRLLAACASMEELLTELLALEPETD